MGACEYNIGKRSAALAAVFCAVSFLAASALFAQEAPTGPTPEQQQQMMEWQRQQQQAHMQPGAPGGPGQGSLAPQQPIVAVLPIPPEDHTPPRTNKALPNLEDAAVANVVRDCSVKYLGETEHKRLEEKSVKAIFANAKTLDGLCADKKYEDAKQSVIALYSNPDTAKFAMVQRKCYMELKDIYKDNPLIKSKADVYDYMGVTTEKDQFMKTDKIDAVKMCDMINNKQ